MQESGVYRILNIKTGKMYIGSSVNITKRLWQHATDLKRGLHHCVYLQRSYNKWGRDIFDFDVIEYVDDITKLIEREQFYIDNVGINNLYNINPTAGSRLGSTCSEQEKDRLRTLRLGATLTEDTKIKMSIARQGYTFSEQIKAKISASNKNSNRARSKKRAVQKIDIQTGMVLDNFESINEASRQTGINTGNISNVCHGNDNVAGGYIWKFIK